MGEERKSLIKPMEDNENKRNEEYSLYKNTQLDDISQNILLVTIAVNTLFCQLKEKHSQIAFKHTHIYTHTIYKRPN